MYNVHWTYDDMSYAIHFLLDNIFVRFDNNVFRQICSKFQWELIEILLLICFYNAINLIYG